MISQLNYLSVWPLPQALAHTPDEQCASQSEAPTQARRRSFLESGPIMACSRNREETPITETSDRGGSFKGTQLAKQN